MDLSPNHATSPSSSLYCTENVASWSTDDDNAGESVPLSPPSPLPLHGSAPVLDLIAGEVDHLPLPDYLPRLLSRSIDPTARQDAVNWIIKLNEFYRFRPVTACLAVSYLDRFLSSHSLPGGGAGWAMQLLSVACVSVAAKMEESHVPHLPDLQIMEPAYVFEPCTVCRMELHLMSALQWRMRGVTPFDFLDPLLSAATVILVAERAAILARAGYFIVNTHRVIDFLAYRPSAIAAAALLCAAEEIADSSAGLDADSLTRLVLDSSQNSEAVRGCRHLMEEYLVDTCPTAVGTTPQSPVGVLDAAACDSCDSQTSGVPEEREVPPVKRRRLGG